MGNYISLNREIRDHPIWTSEPFTKGQAWVDLLMMVNYKDNYVLIKNKNILIKRGQRLTTEAHLAKTWKWSRGKVQRFLAYLENESMISTTTSKSIGTTITITNYNKWQDNRTTDDTTNRTTNNTTNEQRTDNRQDINNKENKVNNNYIYREPEKNINNSELKPVVHEFETVKDYWRALTEWNRRNK